jgi:hypothetical protein
VSRGNRINAFTVRYNREEAALVMKAAAELSLEVASWIRMVSVQAARVAVKKGQK